MEKFNVTELKKELARMILAGEIPCNVGKCSTYGDHKVVEANYEYEGLEVSLGFWNFKTRPTYYSTCNINLKGCFTDEDEEKLRGKAWSLYKENRRNNAAQRIKELYNEIEKLEAVIAGKEDKDE